MRLWSPSRISCASLARRVSQGAEQAAAAAEAPVLVELLLQLHVSLDVRVFHRFEVKLLR
jgi:hypothetical protein